MSQFLRPSSDISLGSWTPFPSTPSTLWDKIDETIPDNDTTYIKNASFSASTCKINLSSGSTPEDGVRTLRFAARKENKTSQSLKVNLMESGVLVQSTTITPSTSYTFYTLTIEASITDYSSLSIEFVCTALGGISSTRVTQAEFEIPDAAPSRRIFNIG